MEAEIKWKVIGFTFFEPNDFKDIIRVEYGVSSRYLSFIKMATVQNWIRVRLYLLLENPEGNLHRKISTLAIRGLDEQAAVKFIDKVNIKLSWFGFNLAEVRRDTVDGKEVAIYKRRYLYLPGQPDDPNTPAIITDPHAEITVVKPIPPGGRRRADPKA